MKYFNTLCIVSCFLFFSSCKNDKRTSRTPAATNWGTSLTATINGDKFTSSVKVLTFTASNQTYLTTADNPDPLEYTFNLIIKPNKDYFDPKVKRYGFIEKKDKNGKKTSWKLPDNFDFTSHFTESGKYLEGTFSFTANAFDKGVEDSTNQLVVKNGKFKAFKTR